MNTVATSLGIRRPAEEHLQYLLRRYDRSLPFASIPRYVLKVNRNYGCIFGVGGFSRFIEEYSKNSDPTPFYGLKLVTQNVLSAFFGGSLAKHTFRKFRVTIWRDGKMWFRKASATNVAASTIRHIGFGFKPFYGADSADGAFGLLVFTSPPRKWLFYLPQMYRGEPIADPAIIQLPTYDAVIKLSTPLRPMLDGDILPAGKEFHIQSGPRLEMVTE